MDTPKIDVSRYLREMEELLQAPRDPIRCFNAVAILRRWRFDEMLDEASRVKAGILVHTFESWYAPSLPEPLHGPKV